MHSLDNVVYTGSKLDESEIAILAIHGRGATADSILSLKEHLNTPNAAWIAPQASGNTWYPYSFMAPFENNQPHLDSALQLVHGLMNKIDQEGPGLKRTLVLGFSQGGCLALESVARFQGSTGGVAGLSSGLIGPEGTQWENNEYLLGTEVFIGCADPDSHIPITRVNESDTFFNSQNSVVTTRIYPNGGHTINEDELKFVQSMIDRILKK